MSVYEDLGTIRVYLDGNWYRGKIHRGEARGWYYRSEYKSRNGNKFFRKIKVRRNSDVYIDIAHYVQKYTKYKVQQGGN